ncbi:MAG: 16S rRNA (guanine(527)-N(7))-methyltransferase RsmG [Solirubrobacteraceae bacterium]|nr:16S rRNA (guanine(527)-N(7))-methyltransferase RsmG [Solirubrobacteraceae bacterium]
MNRAEARLHELAAKHDLAETAVAHARRLLELWETDELASTRVTSMEEAVDQHLSDSWVALELDVIRSATRAADLGTGAGIPALPLAIALPGLRMALVESVGRRTVFLERAIEECGLEDRTQIVAERAEGWPEGIGQHDLITSRALATLDVVLEYSAPLLELGGVSVAWKAALSTEEREGGFRAAEALGMEIVDEIVVEPFKGARERRLVVAKKVAETPARFPRREGMAKKKPLGAPPRR